MSQPLNLGPGEEDPLAVVLKSRDQLLALFADGARPKDRMLMGIEHEMFGHDRNLNQPVSYEGASSISSLFLHMAKHSDPSDPFVPVMEGQNIVALMSKKGVIALEPGGQIEIAARPEFGLIKLNDAFMAIAKELYQRAFELDIDLFAIGVHPIAQCSEMARVKKKRYKIMHDRMLEQKGLGSDMMNRTCSIQLNIDYSNEQDMVLKARLAASLMPFLALLCSSSAFLEGKPTKRVLERAHIWQKTDTERTGFPSIIFDSDFGYESWINYALKVPMYFIRRGSDYIDVR
ncbi:MAG TPA: glutamate-cysteine ligase family protein, partial [Myxococcota bacterium]|nr:glutamate-cysteine ligase family protein [Myxococcota bacterium]